MKIVSGKLAEALRKTGTMETNQTSEMAFVTRRVRRGYFRGTLQTWLPVFNGLCGAIQPLDFRVIYLFTRPDSVTYYVFK